KVVGEEGVQGADLPAGHVVVAEVQRYEGAGCADEQVPTDGGMHHPVHMGDLDAGQGRQAVDDHVTPVQKIVGGRPGARDLPIQVVQLGQELVGVVHGPVEARLGIVGELAETGVDG